MKTRFAPSPTGELHFGNLRTALFNFLVALKENGHFLLRIEDTDKARSKDIYIQKLSADLKWLGLQWHEGYGATHGELGPYQQSVRGEIYDKYYQQLLENKQAYVCFCSEEQLAIQRKVQLAQGLPPRYPGTCRNLSKEEVAKRSAAGEQHVLRFLVPAGQAVEFDDIVKGPQRFSSSDLSDFIIQRTDGSPSFMYCSVLDDSLMKVDLVLRGEDHLTNTPRQLLLMQALKMPAPRYGHLSLMISDTGDKLSKRLGSLSIEQLREKGFLAAAIVNYLARVGHSYPDLGLANLAQLAEHFEFSNLSISPARFDASHLEYWQKEAVMALTSDEFLEWIRDTVLARVPQSQHELFAKCVQPNVVFLADAEKWQAAIYSDELRYNQAQQEVLQQVPEQFFQQAAAIIESQEELDFKALAQQLGAAFNLKGKKLFMPLRIALTGQTDGPQMADLMQLIGKERVVQRLLACGEIKC